MTYTMCGTPNYLSPEVILNQGHGTATDHWSLGVMIYEMVAGENPFYYDDMPQMELFETIVKEKFYPLPDDVSDEAFYVIDGLLEKDTTYRLGSLAGKGKDIINKEWFNELDLCELRQKKFQAPFIPHNAELEALMAVADKPKRTSSAAPDVFAASAPPVLGGGALPPPRFGSAGPSSGGLLDDSDSD